MQVNRIDIQYFGNNSCFDDAKVTVDIEGKGLIVLTRNDKVAARKTFDFISNYIGTSFWERYGVSHQNQIKFQNRQGKHLVGIHYLMEDFLSKFRGIKQIDQWFSGSSLLTSEKSETSMKNLIKFCFEKKINPQSMTYSMLEYDLHFPVKSHSSEPIEVIKYKAA